MAHRRSYPPDDPEIRREVESEFLSAPNSVLVDEVIRLRTRMRQISADQAGYRVRAKETTAALEKLIAELREKLEGVNA